MIRCKPSIRTDLRPKNDKTRGYSGLVAKVVCSSYVTHQKVKSYSWIFAITRAYSPLKSTSSTTALKWSWSLSISFASDPTRSWVLLWSQVFAGWSYITQWPRMSFGTIVNRSQVTLEIFIASVSRRSGRGSDSGAWVYADRLTNGVRGSRVRKSIAVRSQVTLTTWPIIHSLFNRMSVAPQHRCKC